MKVKDLDGNTSSWKLSGYGVSGGDNRKRSGLHLKARSILKELFKNLEILEEVPVSTRKFKTQFLDFYIPNIKLVVEVHGQQHYKFNSLYHSSAQDFISQKKLDRDKKEWCEINGLTYVELPYNEEDEWTNKIQKRHQTAD